VIYVSALAKYTLSWFDLSTGYFALRGVLDNPSMSGTAVPAIVFFVFQLMFAAITYVLPICHNTFRVTYGLSSPMLALGAVAERGRLLPTLLFIFIWSTLVYDPIACWTWNPNGWSRRLGVLDFAGGTVVHISSGTTALAISIFLGRRQGNLAYKPHNTTYVILGTIFLWFGWFGFNGGNWRPHV